MPVTEADDVWTQVTLALRMQLAESVWFSTFQDVQPISADNDTLRLLAPSGYVRDRILKRYLPLVTDALEDAGEGHRTIEIDVKAGADHDESVPDEHHAAPIDNAPADTAHQSDTANTPSNIHLDTGPAALSERDLVLEDAGLSSDYSFETFVKGASNQFALAAALRVAETPARSYNPLFIYGAAGLGKTHLLYAIGHYVHSNYQHHKVRYVSTETFMNEYVESIRQNTTNLLRQRYRDVDVLLIDDIQFIANKEGLQEEFFHTFNALHGANKQIVISSDRTPDNIPTLEERLRSRFKWGLITDIQPPDVETRLAILRNKADREDVDVPAAALEFIAENISTNIRELEGALVRVMAFASLSRQPITIDLVQSQLEDLLTLSQPKIRTDEELLQEIADILRFDVEALKGKSRQRPLVTARQIAMYVFRDLTDLSYPAIARLFGGRDHTTVIHANDKIQRLMKERKEIYDQVTALILKLKA
ncbi:chromosomal replication initiator protein DnaA [Ilumatobacter coccineus]|uniref:Chromosomal replication initiator protein DnaA n=1 Tax=Ilumatobacter coccineus (strain NBRC 103263 / KCTC 29153 / YM16-304) TaxID=1313172 RepID=A0A6C7E4X3_ILUCY|nr:chromosomal replication initiator protein DnaA [Ilumatobacter coccineus]BAN00315.1 chromosomal replication initiator protein DnaA [Ilumatobacter coccineus YM16-304]